MAQNFFGTLTAPQLPLLDANFTELYGFKNLFTIAGANVGLGVAVAADWESGGKAFQIGPSSVLYNPGSGSHTVLASNLVYTTGVSAAKYINSGATAVSYNQDNGRHRFWTAPVGTAGAAATLTEQLQIENAGTVRPGGDGAQNFGSASFRWAQLFASTGTINTSDAREKTSVRALTTAEVNAAKALATEIGAFKFLGAIAAKGEASARWHVGMTVQRAIEVMTEHGLSPFAYGLICYDEWGADEEAGLSAGNRYSLRPDELLFFISRGFEARLAALEAAAP
jgi:hypothetical protein